MKKTGILYIVPTPIGNLEDITLRAIRVLKEVDLIACEDTRVTQKLLNHYEIKTQTVSYHKFSEKEKSTYLINQVIEGKNIALVSDAGTPLISDPGHELIKEADLNEIKIVPLAGASSVITALSAGMCDDGKFAFLGFLPKTFGEKEKLLSKFTEINAVVFESPNRLLSSLEDILKIEGDKNVVVARELTKFYEEIKRGKISELIDFYSKNHPKGEIVLIIEGIKNENSADVVEIIEKIKILKKEGFATKEISKIISLLFNFPKKDAYNLALNV
jgi:16S rRNA (cytidine1402-2'-O)-methyltransferase